MDGNQSFMADRLNTIIAGGGTGGHLFPAMAIGNEIARRQPEAMIHYIGSKFGVEADIFPARVEEFSLLPIRGFQRDLNLRAWGRNSLLPVRLLSSLFTVKRIFKKLKPAVVVGTGGYASALPLYEAQRLGIPTVIQEQNSFPGLTTRRFADKADKICIAFAAAQAYIPKKNCVLTGNPTREGIAKGDTLAGMNQFKLNPEKKTLFLFGGSQGSQALNNIMITMVTPLRKAGIQILWQTGKSNLGTYRKFAGENCKVVPFIIEMDKAYACADLILSRAGALSLSEMTVCGKPSILVPFPNAAGDHQMQNARAMADAGAAILIPEKKLETDMLLSTIMTLLNDEPKLSAMSAASRALGKPEATSEIVDHILEVAA